VPRSVLIVDDDPAFRALAGRMIRGAGMEVAGEADAAQTAIASAEELRPDAILVDVGLPDRSGIELAHDLARRPWSPTVVLVSSDPDSAPGADDGTETPLPFVPKAELPGAPLERLLSGI
jgi:CheY-like chemotaxis protein